MSKKSRTGQSWGECFREEQRREKDCQRRVKKEEKNGRKAEKSGDGQRLKKGRENKRSEQKVKEVQ